MSNTELHNMIGSALDEVAAPPAPVQAVIGRGRALRLRRRVGVAASLAVAAAVAVAVPGLVRDIGVKTPPPKVKPPSVTVSRLGPIARHGVIAAGTINSVPWTVRLSRQGAQLCTTTSSQTLNCEPARDISTGGAPVDFSEQGGSHRYSMVGPVAARVSLIRVWLSDGARLRLYPVRFGDKRWVGLLMPAGLTIRRAAAYSPSGELAYAIPFQGDALPSFVTWLRPEQPGHARVTKMIATGSAGRRWTTSVYLGPWGECIKTLRGRETMADTCSALTPVRHVAIVEATGGKMGLSAWVAGWAPAQVRSLRFWLSDGSSVRVAAMSVDGRRYFALVIADRRTHVLRWSAYNAAGRHVAGGRGLPG